MGCYNALKTILAGHHHVSLYDTSEDNLARAKVLLKQFAQPLIDATSLSIDDFDDALSRVVFTTNMKAALSSADIVSESVFEQREIKRKVLAEVEANCPPECIITTNTSAIMPSELEASITKGERFAAFHSYIGISLIDIVACSKTSPETINTLEEYARSFGGAPFVLDKEYPGYIFNAILGSFFTAALLLLERDVDSIEQIDTAWCEYSGAPAGPFAVIDHIGINVVYDSWKDTLDIPHDQFISKRVVKLLQPYLDRGALGINSHQGFYDYTLESENASKPLAEDTLAPTNNEQKTMLTELLSTTIVARALLILSADIASESVIDGIWREGSALSFAPFQTLHDWGYDTFIERLDSAQLSIELLSSESIFEIKLTAARILA